MVAVRREYCFDLSGPDSQRPSGRATDVCLREVQAGDARALGELMLEAYRGTTDYEGETLDDAVNEIRAYLAGERGGEPLLAESRLAFAGPLAVGACLACHWDAGQLPLITYAMTRAAWKKRGVGTQMLLGVLRALREQGHREVRAVITEGNAPSERLFRRVGFLEVAGT